MNHLNYGDYDAPERPESCELAAWNDYIAAWNHYWDLRSICTMPKDRVHRQLTRHAYPGQPSTRAQHVVQVCSCTYLVVQLGSPEGGLVMMPTPGQRAWDGIAASHILELWGGPVASLFVIAPECPHHGHRANTHLIERLWSDPYSNGILRDPYDMDDNERSGH